MSSVDAVCELELYPGAAHCFFNKSKPKYADTLQDMDTFLVSLGYLDDNSLGAEEALHSADDRATRMQWWRDAKFGMFVHWKIYSVTGGAFKGQKLPNSVEWMINCGKIPIAAYRKYADRFYPMKFNEDVFVGLAKRAGMKYLVITAKHRDGFCCSAGGMSAIGLRSIPFAKASMSLTTLLPAMSTITHTSTKPAKKTGGVGIGCLWRLATQPIW